ncbi:MAG: hypothetical protein J7M26_06040 [Armatimonadetes bacterium]|nr:hypothetical protein [Armatimonadota bacterium]
MATTREQCVNYEINILMCPCTSETCEHRGICCECIQSHYARGGKTACMRGAARDPNTMTLAAQADKICEINQQRNLEFCLCTWEPCEKKGVCCNCVRNHFTVDGSGRVACMR